MKNVLTAIALTVALPLSAQQQPYIETFDVRLHNLDVVVSDAQGRSVRGLTKEDFVVTEDGVAREVTNFSRYDATSARAGSPTDAQSTVDESAAPPPRTFAFFIDELSIQKPARDRLIKSALALVRNMRPGDVALVVRPTGTDRIVQERTSDVAALESAIRGAIEKSRSTLDTQLAEEIRFLTRESRAVTTPGNAEFSRREYASMVRRRVEQRLGQIRALVSSMSRTEGRKVVVLITGGLSAMPGREAFDYTGRMSPGGDEGTDTLHGAWDPVPDFRARIDDLARTAAASGVTIYAVEPDVPLTMTNFRGDVTVRGGTTIVPPTFLDEYLHNSAMTLTSLTEKTGGRWSRGIRSIDDTFEQLEEDLSNYYSLAYRANGEEAQVHKVRVTIRNRPELTVRTRTDVLEKSIEREMEDLVVASLLYPRTVNELEIDVQPGKPAGNRGLFTIPVEIVMPLKLLTFLPNAEGKYVATFNVHYAAAGEKIDFSAGGHHQQHVEITAEQYANLGTINYRYKTGIEVARGPVRLAIGVLDTVSKLTGFETIDVLAQ